MNTISKNKFGFTLAEVLITLGIIGVVSAMTIPQLITSYRQKQMRTRFIKTYATLQQVFKRMEADDVSLDASIYGSNNNLFFYKEVEKYVKASQVCFRDNLKFPCYDYNGSRKYKNRTGTSTLSYTLFDDGQIVLMDGTLLLFESPNAGSDILVFVDINGQESQPNRLGYDLFAFQFVNGTLKPMGDLDTTYEGVDKYCKKIGGGSSNGMACSLKALKDPLYFKNIDKLTD